MSESIIVGAGTAGAVGLMFSIVYNWLSERKRGHCDSHAECAGKISQHEICIGNIKREQDVHGVIVDGLAEDVREIKCDVKSLSSRLDSVAEHVAVLVSKQSN